MTATGRFPSIGTRGLLLTRGRWYYEVTLQSSGCMQVVYAVPCGLSACMCPPITPYMSMLIQLGWCDGSYTGASEHGEGVGDDGHSWAYDGYRQLRWHEVSTPWGARWSKGDTIMVAVDIEARVMLFGRNGSWAPPMGVAFAGFEFDRGLAPVMAGNRGEKVQFSLGTAGRPFKYVGVGFAAGHLPLKACRLVLSFPQVQPANRLPSRGEGVLRIAGAVPWATPRRLVLAVAAERGRCRRPPGGGTGELARALLCSTLQGCAHERHGRRPGCAAGPQPCAHSLFVSTGASVCRDKLQKLCVTRSLTQRAIGFGTASEFARRGC